MTGTWKQVRKTAACDTHIGFLRIPLKLALVSEVFHAKAKSFQMRTSKEYNDSEEVKPRHS